MSRNVSYPDAEGWRARAEEILAIAGDIKDIHVIAILHSIAEDYLRLAELATIRVPKDKRRASP
jgi:hypothetical protein